MSSTAARALLRRLENRAIADANNASLLTRWRHAAAFVSGTLGMKAELLLLRPPSRAA